VDVSRPGRRAAHIRRHVRSDFVYELWCGPAVLRLSGSLPLVMYIPAPVYFPQSPLVPHGHACMCRACIWILPTGGALIAAIWTIITCGLSVRDKVRTSDQTVQFHCIHWVQARHHSIMRSISTPSLALRGTPPLQSSRPQVCADNVVSTRPIVTEMKWLQARRLCARWS
jgi:hypothetical protein